MAPAIIQTQQISQKEFTLFREIVYEEAGISLSDHKSALVQSRLMKRLKALRLNNFKSYYNYLMDNYDAEVVNLLNCITTNKTDFFRENQHFVFIRDKLLTEFANKKQKQIRIWSAGCSTGEEPYSIAITLFDYYSRTKTLMPDIKILATDIDTNVINTGKEGKYKADVLEDVNAHLLKKYFLKGSRENEGFYKVKNSLKKIITFRRLNLLNETYPMKKQFDLIFCRNVIIYFDNETRRKIFDRFHGYLTDDGYFFAGHSENINSFSDKFKLIGNTVYMKAV